MLARSGERRLVAQAEAAQAVIGTHIANRPRDRLLEFLRAGHEDGHLSAQHAGSPPRGQSSRAIALDKPVCRFSRGPVREQGAAALPKIARCGGEGPSCCEEWPSCGGEGLEAHV